jgi:hypothetical protein
VTDVESKGLRSEDGQGSAPTLETFGATVQLFLREEWHRYVLERIAHDNITRRGAERVTLKQMQQRVPPPKWQWQEAR